MKIIFLDIDGVLNCHQTFRNKKSTYEYNELDDIDPENVKHLNKILSETNANIVISSSWRLHKNIHELKFLAEQVNVDPLRIIDKTPDLSKVSYERGYEIQKWLDGHKDIEKFVILDDDEDMLHLKKFLIKTSSSTGGLTEEKANDAIKLLNS